MQLFSFVRNKEAVCFMACAWNSLCLASWSKSYMLDSKVRSRLIQAYIKRQWSQTKSEIPCSLRSMSSAEESKSSCHRHSFPAKMCSFSLYVRSFSFFPLNIYISFKSPRSSFLLGKKKKIYKKEEGQMLTILKWLRLSLTQRNSEGKAEALPCGGFWEV